MTRTTGSVPEGRRTTRPFSPNSWLASETALVISGSMPARSLSAALATT